MARVLVEIGAREHVGDVRLRRREQAHAARDSGMPPLILILDEARVGPADDDRDELVRAVVAHQRADVELGRRARVLRDPDRLSVQQDVQRSLDASEVQHDPAPAPATRHRELAPVDPRRILVRHARGPRVERHHDVRVVRRAEALHRPEAGNLDRLEAAGGRERAPAPRPGARPPQQPLAVERPPAACGALERRVRREAVQARQLRGLPAGAAAGCSSASSAAGERSALNRRRAGPGRRRPAPPG